MIKTQDKGRSGLWDKALAGIVASINHAPTEKLKGESPDDVAEDTQAKVTDSTKKEDVLTFELQEKAAEDMQKNVQKQINSLRNSKRQVDSENPCEANRDLLRALSFRVLRVEL